MASGGRVLAALVLAVAAASAVDGPHARAGGKVADPTSDGKITRTTHTLYRAIASRGLDGNGMRCHAPRPQNPDSDHPRGRACDVMFNPHSATSVRAGWRLARWLTEHDERYRITYLIWQGRYWDASQGWGTYHSTAYGCPNPANLTGCHYDHLHWSVAA